MSPRLRIELSGTEIATIECTGVASRAAVRRRVPAMLGLCGDGDDAEIGLLCFAMEGLGASQPVRIGPRFDYAEALWRAGVVWNGEPAWFAIACDLDRAFVRTLGAMIVRYPVRTAAIDVGSIGDGVMQSTIGGEAGHFEVQARVLDDAPEPTPPRPLLVAHGDALYRIPWREDPAPFRRTATITVVDAGLEEATLDTRVRWTLEGLVHRGRVHRCGVASRVRIP